MDFLLWWIDVFLIIKGEELLFFRGSGFCISFGWVYRARVRVLSLWVSGARACMCVAEELLDWLFHIWFLILSQFKGNRVYLFDEVESLTVGCAGGGELVFMEGVKLMVGLW